MHLNNYDMPEIDRGDFIKGQEVLFFDDIHWSQIGHDVGNNDVFYKKANINGFRNNKQTGFRTVADLILPDGRVSTGHFISSLKTVA